MMASHCLMKSINGLFLVHCVLISVNQGLFFPHFLLKISFLVLYSAMLQSLTLSLFLSVDPLSLSISQSLSHRTFFTGPLSHYFYAWLQKTFPGKDVPTSIKKILCDRLVFAPPYLLIFFYLLGIIEVMFAVVQHLLQALFHPKYEVRARFAVGF